VLCEADQVVHRAHAAQTFDRVLSGLALVLPVDHAFECDSPFIHHCLHLAGRDCHVGGQQLADASEGDERTALRVLAHALEVPARQIADNSGMDPGVVIERIRSGTGGFGFDGATGKFLDLMEAGIIDPAKVVRVAVQNAISVAGTLLLAEATMTQRDEPKDKQPAEQFA